MPLPTDAIFAGFRIVRLLGSGGMGEVYLAEHPRLPRRDALKILPTEVSANAEFRQPFNREADLASTLFHPHIVGVHDRGECNGQLWISMDYVDGPDTSRLLRERYPAGMPRRDAFKIVAAVAEALDYAHNRGLLHRDVKPANILLTDPDSEAKRILLADFGIARRLDDISGLTATNMTVGTVSYAAPEQLMDSGLDGRADQYALAATAFHLLTGCPPFAHSNPAVVISHHLNAPPPGLGDLRPDLEAHSGALARGLSKHPDDRFESCTAFARALSGDAQVTATGESTLAAATRPAPITPADDVPKKVPPRSAPKTTPSDGAPKKAAPSIAPRGAPPGNTAPKRPTSYPAKPLIRAGTVLATLLAVVLIAAVTFAGIQLSKSPQSSQSSPPTTTAATNAPETALTSPAPAAGPAALACGDGQALLAGMSTRDKLAQLLMVGVTGAADARAVVTNDHVGGINITSWTDLSMLSDGSPTNIAASAGPLPLAVSVDEEGGRVSRLAGLIGSQSSPRVLAAGHTPEEVYSIALARGQAMRKLGITIDFAPVVDVTDAPDDTVIGDRSFGADPTAVTDYAGAYARGLRDAGLLPVLKHFPGYGHGSGDTHTGSVVTPPIADLRNNDLIPYRTLTTQGPVGVMVGHIQVPGLTGSDPASLSPAAYALLRSGDYGGPPFNGPVFTDDLTFPRAINTRYPIGEASLRALQAGADNALSLSADQVPAVLDRLEKALAAGELTMPRVDASVLRIAAVKGPNPRC